MKIPVLRRTATAALLSLTLAMPAMAQQAEPTPEHLALARAVIDFTGATRAFDSVAPKLLQDARTMILRTHPAVQQDLDSVIAGMESEFSDKEDELVDDIVRIYAEKFTEADLKEIAAFYQSPAGRKMTETIPEVLRESYQSAQEWGRELSVEVINRIREEMKKKGHEI